MACRKTAVSARRVALQMIHNTIVCAPDGLRDQLRSLTRMQLVRTLASWRPDLTACRDLDSAYRIGLKPLARCYLELHDEIADLDVMIASIVDELAPNLIARNSIGRIGASQLLLTAGDNPERLRSEASFASLCGVSPVPGKTVRHRHNRGMVQRNRVDENTGAKSIEWYGKRSFIADLNQSGRRVLRIFHPPSKQVLFGPPLARYE